LKFFVSATASATDSGSIRRGDALLVTLERANLGEGFVVDGETVYALLTRWDDPGPSYSWRALPL